MPEHYSATDPVFLWEVLVPCQWNNGHPVRTRHHKVWERRVHDVGVRIERWSGPSRWDAEMPVRVACTRKQMDQIMDITAQHYKQLAVMAYVVATEVHIKHYPPGFGHAPRQPSCENPVGGV